MKSTIIRLFFSVTFTLFVATLAITTAPEARAEKIPAIDRDYNSNATLGTLYQAFASYDQYSATKGAKFTKSFKTIADELSIPVPATGFDSFFVPMLNMYYTKVMGWISAPPVLNYSAPVVSSEALVVVALQPANLTELKDYPQVLLNCAIATNNGGGFTQVCNQVKQFVPVTLSNGVTFTPKNITKGLSDFSSTSTITQNGNGSHHIHIHIDVETNPTDIAQIKNAVKNDYEKISFIGSYLSSKIDELFSERKFFTEFYEQFYNSWLGSI